MWALDRELMRDAISEHVWCPTPTPILTKACFHDFHLSTQAAGIFRRMYDASMMQVESHISSTDNEPRLFVSQEANLKVNYSVTKKNIKLTNGLALIELRKSAYISAI